MKIIDITAAFAVAPLAITAGCTVSSESGGDSSRSEVVDELVERAAERAGAGGDDAPYGDECSDFEDYGECAYCEIRDWSYGEPCVTVCWAFCCNYDLDNCEGGCYDDCSWSV